MENSTKPAFSTSPVGWEVSDLQNGMHVGLTKREYFAAMAMQGLVGTLNPNDELTENLTDVISKESVLMADALLKRLSE